MPTQSLFRVLLVIALLAILFPWLCMQAADSGDAAGDPSDVEEDSDYLKNLKILLPGPGNRAWLAVPWPAPAATPATAMSIAQIQTVPLSHLQYAVRTNDLRAVEFLLDNGVDPNTDFAGNPAAIGWLFGSQSTPKKERSIKNRMLLLLLQRGLKVATKQPLLPVLDCAIRHDDLDAVKILLDHGADPDVSADYSRSPIISCSNDEMLQLVGSRYLNPTSKDLKMAIAVSNTAVARYLYARMSPAPDWAGIAIWLGLVVVLSSFLYRRNRGGAVAVSLTPAAAPTDSLAALSEEFDRTRVYILVPLMSWAFLWVLFFIDPCLRGDGVGANLITLAIGLSMAAVAAHCFRGRNTGRRRSCQVGMLVGLAGMGWCWHWFPAFWPTVGAPWMAALVGLVGAMQAAWLLQMYELAALSRSIERVEKAEAAAHPEIKEEPDFGDIPGWDEAKP